MHTVTLILSQVGVLLLQLAASSLPAGERVSPGNYAPMQPGPAVVELLMASKVPPGDTVEITLRLRNNSIRPLALQLPGRPVAFDVVISRADGAPVWRRLNRGLVSSA